MRTVLEGEKVTTQCQRAKLCVAGFTAMKFHAGKTAGQTHPFVTITSKEGQSVHETDGDVIDDRIFGTYIHGIFDSSEFRTRLLNRLRRTKSLAEKHGEDLNQQREAELGKLAQIVRENLDMPFIYSLIKK
jgi:adenosylcobyric acid synthase